MTDDQAGGGSILVVSNRLPLTLRKGPKGLERSLSSGGLVSALTPVLERRGGTWVGWPGAALPEGFSLSDPADPYRIEPISLSEDAIEEYYYGFSNAILWPLLHSFPTRTDFARPGWERYEQVNRTFAQSALEHARRADIVWIHDYQLMRMPLHLRALTPESRIAFFLHIPFPAYDIFRLLPWDRELLRGLLACDLVGFQVEGYARNFMDCVERLLSSRVDREAGRIEHGERTVQVAAFPIGIDFDVYEERAGRAPPIEGQTERILLGVDRLDYTKGIPEKIRAFERLLELHPEHRGHVVLLQIAVPSRDRVAEYRRLKRQIDELVGRVNGRFSTATWTPIRYLHRSVGPGALSELYRRAQICLVTPLRDGMNLVAKEYVASQIDEDGVLILSRLAGAAETMRESILVNPYNIDGVAKAIDRALTMDPAERRSRMSALRLRERSENVHRWVNEFLTRAMASGTSFSPATDRDFARWIQPFLRWRRRLALFLDFDGTLAPIVRHPSLATLSEDMKAALGRCAERNDTDITIVSGRALPEVQRLVDIPRVAYAGNHGLEISGPNLPAWRHPDLGYFETRLRALAVELRALCIPGAWIEEKGASITFHFREADPALAEALATTAREVIGRAGFQAYDAHQAVEGRPPVGWDKGRAVLHILRERYGPTWSADIVPLYIGDDRTDEDAFRVLSGLGPTFRVGSPETPTAASHPLPNVESVRALIEYLAQRASDA